MQGKNALIPSTHLEVSVQPESDLWPLSSSTGATGVKGLAQGHHNGVNDGGPITALVPAGFVPARTIASLSFRPCYTSPPCSTGKYLTKDFVCTLRYFSKVWVKKNL